MLIIRSGKRLSGRGTARDDYKDRRRNNRPHGGRVWYVATTQYTMTCLPGSRGSAFPFDCRDAPNGSPASS
jgi:hypothetical protein